VVGQEEAKKKYHECVKKESAFSAVVKSLHKGADAESFTFNLRCVASCELTIEEKEKSF
jgi:hypothetical protein